METHIFRKIIDKKNNSVLKYLSVLNRAEDECMDNIPVAGVRMKPPPPPWKQPSTIKINMHSTFWSYWSHDLYELLLLEIRM